MVSVIVCPLRETRLPGASIDTVSVDTDLTTPSNPPQTEQAERTFLAEVELPSQVNNPKDDYEETLKPTEDSGLHGGGLMVSKRHMEQDLQHLKQEVGMPLEQSKEHEHKSRQVESSVLESRAVTELNLRQRGFAYWTLQKWRQTKYVRMANVMLQYASTLKEAQILSQQMGKSVVFQFAIVDAGQTFTSSYDIMLSGTSDSDDEELHSSSKPCVAIRVADFKRQSIFVWSLAKLEKRLNRMRQIHQYRDTPQYLKHIRLDDPFSDSWIPHFSHIGVAQIPLATISKSRTQDYSVEVISPFTFNMVGILKLTLEPLINKTPNSKVKFNVILQDIAGFSSLEGTDMHTQFIILPPDGAGGDVRRQSTSGFYEGPIHFGSLQELSLPVSRMRKSNLRISIFARITSLHLDKILSWDDMRDAAQCSSSQHGSSRLATSEFHLEEKHDVFAKVQILELSEHGEYEPVDVIKGHAFDHGAYQLHHGIQRRIVIDLTHTCGQGLPWREVLSFRACNIHLLHSTGQISTPTLSQPEVTLNFVSSPSMMDNPDGPSHVRLAGQWDSSAHTSPLLDRPTSEKHRIQLTLQWEVVSSRLIRPLGFSLDVAVQVRPRSYIRASSILSQLWAPIHVAHSTTGIFLISVKPNIVRSITDLWRMDTSSDYVKGEERLNGWVPRGVSLVLDFVVDQKRQCRAAEIQAVRSMLENKCLAVTTSATASDVPLTDNHRKLLSKILEIWRSGLTNPTTSMLESGTLPQNAAAFATQTLPTSARSEVFATVQYQPKNPLLRKSGYLLMPNHEKSRWVRRYLELRLPFLHIHSVPGGDELIAINLHDSRVDLQPRVTKVLQRTPNSNSRLNVFEVHARQNSLLFATRSERQKLEWVLRIDESYFRSNLSLATDNSA